MATITLNSLNQLYYSLRVDHLHEDELNFELMSRGVELSEFEGRDNQATQRRRRLRDLMKAERKGKKEIIRRVHGDPVEDGKLCVSKLVSIKEDLRYRVPNKNIFRSRLLHLVNRLQLLIKYTAGEQNIRISSVLDDLVNYYGVTFDGMPLEQTESEDEENVRVETAHQSACTNDRENSASEPNETDAFHEILNSENCVTTVSQADRNSNDLSGLHEVVSEIRFLRFQMEENRNAEISRTNSLLESIQSILSLVGNISSMSDTMIEINNEIKKANKTLGELITTVHLKEQSYNPNLSVPYRSNICLPMNQYTSSTTSSFINAPVCSTGIPHVTSTILNPRVIPTSSNTGGTNFTPHIPVNNNEPAPGLVDLSNHRRPQRVADWKIPKYGGEDQGLGLNEFLDSVYHYAVSERISQEELFNSAMHLFQGTALNWFLSMRSENRLLNWNHLVGELKTNFVHPELDAILKMKIASRRQQKTESFQEYFLNMEKLFRALSVPLNPEEKLEHLKRNLRPDYKQIMIFKSVNTLAELLSIGKTLDASRVPIFNKVFGNPREVNAITRDQYQTNRPVNPISHSNEGRNNFNKSKLFWNRNQTKPT